MSYAPACRSKSVPEVCDVCSCLLEFAYLHHGFLHINALGPDCLWLDDVAATRINKTGFQNIAILVIAASPCGSLNNMQAQTCMWKVIIVRQQYRFTFIVVLHRIIWSWYSGRWWVGCYIWYSEKGTARGRSQPMPLLAVPNVAHSSMASVPVAVLLYWWSVALRF